MSPTSGIKDRACQSLHPHITSAEPVWADEMSRVLVLWAAQIDAAISESHLELEDLSASFFDFAKEASETLKSSPADTDERSRAIEERVHKALVNFQVSDRLMQRLKNVNTGLLQLGELLQDEAGKIPDDAWQKALEKIRGSYTMAAERRMFDAAIRQSYEPGADAVDIEETGHRLILFDEE